MTTNAENEPGDQSLQGPKRSRRLVASTVVQIALGAVPFAWVASTVNLGEAVRRVAAVGFAPVIFALACMFVSAALGAVRWQVLLRAYQGVPPPPYLTLLKHNLVALYFGLLPGGVGMEAVRAWRTRDAAGGLVRASMIVFVDRLAGLVGLLLIVAAGGLLGTRLQSDAVSALTRAASVLALILCALAVGFPWLIHAVPRLRSRLDRLPRALRSLSAIRPPAEPARLLLALGLSLGTQGAVIAAQFPLLLAIAPATDIRAAIIAAPFVILLTFIPVTPLGIGQREVVFIGLWGAAGVDSAAAVATSVLVFATGLLVSFAGGLVLVHERWRERAREPGND